MSTSTATLTPRIVVGVDGSDESTLALRWARCLSGGLNASIEAVTAWQFPPTFGWPVTASTWTPAADATRTLEETVDEVFGDERPPRLRLTVAQGYPPSVLCRAASQATLLIVGSRGHGGFTGMLLGSVSNSVVHHAACPVLVVHAAQQPAA